MLMMRLEHNVVYNIAFTDLQSYKSENLYQRRQNTETPRK